MFENQDKLVPIVDDGNKRPGCFNPKSFSLDERKKESIYFVKVKKNSDGKKEKHIGKGPTVVNNKGKKILGIHKKSQEKKSVDVVDSSRKDTFSSRKSIAGLPPNEAKWLENRLHKVSHKQVGKSSSLPSGERSSQSNKLVIGEERKKIISSFTKAPTESFSNDERKPTFSDSKKPDFKRFSHEAGQPIEKQLPKIG